MKKHLSLSSELLIGTVGIMLVTALFLCVSFTFLARDILKKSTINSVNQAMETLSGQIESIFTPYEVRVYNIALAASSSATEPVLSGLIHKVTDNLDSENNDLYYATAISRFEEGGYYIDGEAQVLNLKSQVSSLKSQVLSLKSQVYFLLNRETTKSRTHAPMTATMSSHRRPAFWM